VLRSGSQSALVRRVGPDITLLPAAPREAWGLRPRSKEQRFALDLLLDPEVSIVALDGPAGTGKSLLAIAAALEQVVETPLYQRVSVFRPLVPVGREDIGYLPGDLATKTQPYFAAIFDAVTALTERRSMRDAEQVIEQLLQAGQLTMEPITFLRGRSLASSFIIVDEATNLERAILKTLLTRVSDGTKIVFTGDVSQIDNPFASASNNALTGLISAFEGQRCFGHVRLTACERSEVASLAATLL
jgi:PhoH-like ATPase